MPKRASFLFAVLAVLLFFNAITVYQISGGTGLAEAAADQQFFTVPVVSQRGTIYDRNRDPLTGNGKEEYPTAVAPGTQAAAALKKVMPAADWNDIRTLLSSGKPFAVKLPAPVSAAGVKTFAVKKRYGGSTAAHVLGYLDGSGKGASGIEKAYDDALSSTGAKITVSYQVDALGHVLPEGNGEVSDSTALARGGVVLTLDGSIQKLAERAAAKYLKKGAAVVLSVPSGQILAMASLPAFSPDDVSSVLESEDSPLLNRAVSAYNVGSVFKIAAAAAALEDGVSPAEQYRCVGYEEAGGMLFHCYDSQPHGTEDMKLAIANSCNSYFVHLMKQIPQADFLHMAVKLGFGKPVALAPGMEAEAGTLPSLQSLGSPRAIANFSIGQGDLTATPLQVAAMVNAVAAGGVYTEPTLVIGRVNENHDFVERSAAPKSTRAMSEKTARLLQEFMAASVDSGTGKKGKPDYGTAGAKTGTAQTGRYQNGEEEVESWYAGFYPRGDPKFAIAVFAEGGSGGGASCGPVFREIANGLYGYVS